MCSTHQPYFHDVATMCLLCFSVVVTQLHDLLNQCHEFLHVQVVNVIYTQALFTKVITQWLYSTLFYEYQCASWYNEHVTGYLINSNPIIKMTSFNQAVKQPIKPIKQLWRNKQVHIFLRLQSGLAIEGIGWLYEQTTIRYCLLEIVTDHRTQLVVADHVQISTFFFMLVYYLCNLIVGDPR